MSAPSEAGRTRPSPRTRGFAPFSALALLLLLFSALPGFAQSVVGTISGINGPTFVAIDANRTIGGTTSSWLYVSEHGQANNTGGGRILRYNLSSLSTAPVDIGNGNFTSPDGILIDSATGNLTIADRARNRVVRISNSGTVLGTFGSGTAGAADEMHGPVELATDGSNIYIAEHGDTSGSVGSGGSFVSKYTISGTRVWRVGGIGGGNAQFSNTGPYGVALLGGLLYVSDGFNSRVQALDLNGAYQSQFSMPGALPLGMYVDSTGALWIAQGTNSGDGTGAIQQVQRFASPGGAANLTLTGGLSLPFDVVVDSGANRAYVSDYYNNRVVIFSLTTASGVPVINSAATASGTVGVAFTYNVTATNSPTSYATVDALPASLSLNTTTGAVTGTPSAAGTTTTHFTATNASGTSAQFAVTFTIAAGSSGGTPALPLGPTITRFDLDIPSVVVGSHADMIVTFDTAVTGVDATDFAVNVQGVATASITGVDAIDATSYRVHFNYTDTNGAIQLAIKTSGTGITDGSGHAFRGSGLTATPVYGTGTTPATDQTAPTVASFTAGAASGNNVTYTVTFSEPVTGVDAADFIVTGTSATVGTVTGSGTTWTVPVTASGSGTVTLTVAGGATAAIRDAATNWFGGSGTTSASATIGGGGTPTAPVISSATSASATVGTAFNYQIVASGSPTSYAATGLTGTGLSINTTTGVISGTPSAAGTITSQLTATNSAGTSAAVTLTITVASSGGGTPTAPTITSATSASATAGTAFSYQITATGSPTSYAATGLTGTGLSINTTTGLISGTPSAAGTITSQLTATNSAGTSAAVTLTITVASSGGGTPTVPSITSGTSASATAGTAFSYQITATGSPTSYAATGLTGTGLSINTTTGLISGTPSAAGTITSQLTATNSAGTSAAVTLTITVASSGGGTPTVPSITSGSTAAAQVGTTFSYQITASGSPTSYAATGLSGTGLALNASTGLISGTPTAGGTITSQLTATNSAGTSAPKTLTITVAAAGTPSPSVTSASVSGTVGIPLSLTISATNNATLYLISGQPPGITINNSTGVISGTPTAAGSYSATVTAANGGGSGYGTVTFNIAPGTTNGGTLKGQTVIFSTPTSAIVVGSAIRLGATASSGLPITYTILSGNAVLNGDTLTIKGAGPVVIRAAQAGDSTWAAASTDLTFTATKAPQQIIVGSTNQTVTADVPVKLTAASSSGLPVSYTVVSGPATVSGNTLTFTGTGTVVVRAAQSGDATFDSANAVTMTFVANPVTRLVNISSRLKVSANDSEGSSIAGFVITGSSPKQILIRAVGPGLKGFGIASPLSDPTIKLYDSNGAVIAANTGWSDDTKISAAGDGVGAFKLNKGSADSALLVTLAPGAYTVQVLSAKNSGAVLIEVYDASANAAVPTKQLINISTRGVVGTGDDVLIGGFVVNGTEPKRVLVRAIGPGLTAYHVPNALQDPMLKLYDAQGNVIAQNNDWGTPLPLNASQTPATAAQISAANTASGAFPLVSGSADAVILMTLNPGAYSAVVTGANNTTGSAMVEIYEVPNP